MHALAGRDLAPLRRRPARDAHARDVGKANGPGVLERSRRRTLDEPEPRYEAPLSVAQQVADLTAEAIRQEQVPVVEPAIENQLGHALYCICSQPGASRPVGPGARTSRIAPASDGRQN